MVIQDTAVIDSATPAFLRLRSEQAQPLCLAGIPATPGSIKKGLPKQPRKLLFLRLSRLSGSNGRPSLADLEASKAPYGDVLAQLADLGCNELCDGDGLVLDKGLLQKADLFVKLAHLAFDNFLHDVRWFAGSGRLRPVDVFLALKSLGRDIFLAHELRVAGRDVHSNIVHQLFEVVGARHEIALAVYFHQHTNLAAGMDVAGH